VFFSPQRWAFEDCHQQSESYRSAGISIIFCFRLRNASTSSHVPFFSFALELPFSPCRTEGRSQLLSFCWPEFLNDLSTVRVMGAGVFFFCPYPLGLHEGLRPATPYLTPDARHYSSHRALLRSLKGDSCLHPCSFELDEIEASLRPFEALDIWADVPPRVLPSRAPGSPGRIASFFCFIVRQVLSVCRYPLFTSPSNSMPKPKWPSSLHHAATHSFEFVFGDSRKLRW